MFFNKRGYYQHKETKVIRSQNDYSFMSTREQEQFIFIEIKFNYETKNK